MNVTCWKFLALIGAMALSATSFAQAPLGATGQCKDGSYSMAESKKGACGKHGGVKEWYENNRGPQNGASERGPQNSANAPATSETTTTATPRTTPPASAGRTTPVAGGGAGQVWVNTRSKVYHCQGDKWYGKTAKGEYMSEADAKAKGDHPDHGKACS
jgi:hypothetical protein